MEIMQGRVMEQIKEHVLCCGVLLKSQLRFSQEGTQKMREQKPGCKYRIWGRDLAVDGRQWDKHIGDRADEKN